MKVFYVILADGFEEIEALTPIDYLMRSGLKVVKLGLGHEIIESTRGIKVFSDVVLNDDSFGEILSQVESGEVLGVCVPGGLRGSENIAASKLCENLCKEVFSRGGLLSEICAAPALALGKWEILKNKRFTCYPDMENDVSLDMRQGFLEERVVIDRNLITARGAGVAEEFSFAIIEKLFGKEKSTEIKEQILARD